MPLIAACDNCHRPTPVYRLAHVILDGHMAQICPRCQSTVQERVGDALVDWAFVAFLRGDDI